MTNLFVSSALPQRTEPVAAGFISAVPWDIRWLSWGQVDSAVTRVEQSGLRQEFVAMMDLIPKSGAFDGDLANRYFRALSDTLVSRPPGWAASARLLIDAGGLLWGLALGSPDYKELMEVAKAGLDLAPFLRWWGTRSARSGIYTALHTTAKELSDDLAKRQQNS